MDLKETGHGNMGCIYLVQDRDPVAGSCEHELTFWFNKRWEITLVDK
jgi:hypothetical protein